MPEDEQLMGTETGSIEVEAAPSTPETGAPEGGQSPDNDPKGVAFGKALTAERDKIRKEMEQEYSERYKDYDTYKEVSEYFREANEAADVLTLKEQIEMERLQQRAEQSQVSPEIQKRLEELEAKASEADKIKADNELQNWYKDFRVGVEKFASEKGVDAGELEKFMADNKVPNMEIAYKAMTHSDAEAKAEEIRKQAVTDYLNSKKAPKVEGAGAPGHIPPAAPKNWQEASKGALEMIRAARQQS